MITVLPAIHGMKNPLQLKPNVDLKISTSKFLSRLLLGLLKILKDPKMVWIFISKMNRQTLKSATTVSVTRKTQNQTPQPPQNIKTCSIVLWCNYTTKFHLKILQACLTNLVFRSTDVSLQRAAEKIFPESSTRLESPLQVTSVARMLWLQSELLFCIPFMSKKGKKIVVH